METRTRASRPCSATCRNFALLRRSRSRTGSTRSSITTKSSCLDAGRCVEAGAPRAGTAAGRVVLGARRLDVARDGGGVAASGAPGIVSCCAKTVLSRAAGPRERKRVDGERAGAVEEVLREKRLARAEGASRISQGFLNVRDSWVCAPKHAPRDPCHVLERRHCPWRSSSVLVMRPSPCRAMQRTYVS